jgi:hypothetical protein
MVIRTSDVTGRAEWRGRFAATRIASTVIGVAAIIWGVVTFPFFWREAPIEQIGRRVIQGDPFKAEALIDMIPALEILEQSSDCRPISIHNAAIIRARIAEVSIASGNRERIDSDMSSLYNSIVRSVACTPADPFLWLVLYWVKSARNGFSLDLLQCLRLSYRLGPNEGWIGLKRNGMALAIFEQLSPDLGEMAITEFARLLGNGLYREALSILVGPGWQVRHLLLPRLITVAEPFRQSFADALYKQGYDVEIPGIPKPAPRPWH